MEWTRGPIIIGRGSTAAVSLATALPSGELFAVKSAELSRSGFLQKEQRFLSRLSCPNVVKYMGFDIKTEDNKSTYNLRMEYVPGGTLHQEILRQGGRLPEPAIRSCTKQILLGLDCLHDNSLVHCDVKSQNILMGLDGAKIADLGCARFVKDDRSTISGTPVFMSPEVARGEEQGFSADVWAVGCTVIEMATGSHPWPEVSDPVSALYRIGVSGDVPAFPAWLSEKGIDFLSKCLRQDPRDRWTAKELLQHPFLDEMECDSVEVEPTSKKYKNKKQGHSRENSPTCVLDQGFWDWDALRASESIQDQISFVESPAARMKKLVSDDEANWNWDDEDWVTARSDQTEENNKVSDHQTETVTVSVASSVFEDDLFINCSAENLCSIICIMIDDIVFINFDYQRNDKFGFFNPGLFYLGPI